MPTTFILMHHWGYNQMPGFTQSSRLRTVTGTARSWEGWGAEGTQFIPSSNRLSADFYKVCVGCRLDVMTMTMSHDLQPKTRKAQSASPEGGDLDSAYQTEFWSRKCSYLYIFWFVQAVCFHYCHMSCCVIKLQKSRNFGYVSVISRKFQIIVLAACSASILGQL